MLDIQQEKDFFTIKAVGQLTPKDYEDLTPVIEKAVQKYGSIKGVMNLKDFEGWELEAAWDDFKLGMKYRNAFTKIAIVGDQSWEKWCAKVCHFFMPGDVKFFPLAEFDKAEAWVKA